ncbi:MAG: histidine kinase [Elusimicrobia bacterium RIFOXYC2_FULL_34_12]|nr:MAG: histidine kinase [Elusimicrobia bacterium RIFOXYC2_FULL_34_12]HAM38325.1 histidine kinase [Elusimicrobiota bacterium]
MAETEKTNDAIQALTKISQAITSELYLDDILKLIVTVTAEALGSKICTLMLLNEKGELIIKASQSLSEQYLKKPPLKIGEGIAGKVVEDKKPITILNIAEDKNYKYKEIAKKEGLISLLCVPLTVKGKVIGALDVYTDKPHIFKKSEINILTMVANQSAVVIENTELIVKSKVIAEELESRKLIERAKGILMKNRSMAEDAAYRLIQRQAMDKRKSMKEVAEAIILVNDIRK